MISFSNINKQYGKQLLFVDASFQLNPGEKVGLVGPDGTDNATPNGGRRRDSRRRRGLCPQEVDDLPNLLLLIRSVGARRRNRTVTSCYGPGILSPVRLPVSPSGQLVIRIPVCPPIPRPHRTPRPTLRLQTNLEQQMIFELRRQFRHTIARRVHRAEFFVLAVITHPIFPRLQPAQFDFAFPP